MKERDESVEFGDLGSCKAGFDLLILGIWLSGTKPLWAQLLRILVKGKIRAAMRTSLITEP